MNYKKALKEAGVNTKGKKDELVKICNNNNLLIKSNYKSRLHGISTCIGILDRIHP